MNNRMLQVVKGLLGLVVLVVLLNGYLLIQKPGSMEVADFATTFSSRILDIHSIKEHKSLMLAMSSLIFVVFFNLVFGGYIYNNFVRGASFIFSRVRNRTTWLWKNAGKLYGICGLFTFVYLLLVLTVCLYSSGEKITEACIVIFLNHWLSFTVLLMLSTIWINFLSVKVGNIKAFIIVYGILVLFMQLELHYENIPYIGECYMAHFLNPIAIITLPSLESVPLKGSIILYEQILIAAAVFRWSNCLNYTDIVMLKNREERG